MISFRTQGEETVTFYKGEQDKHQFENKSEWVNESVNLNLGNIDSRIDIPVWVERYKFESNIISDVLSNNKYDKILELGSGPGLMGQMIMEKKPSVDYTFIDQQGAKDIFIKRNYKGRFLVIDLMNSFDTKELDKEYDFIIANDFLEHIYNPSIVIQESYKLLKSDGMMFVSVPNWRMGHTFIYRGLFDYDNFVYFMFTHGFELTTLYESPLKCMSTQKISSETTMPNELINSWNWYMLFKKINN